MKTTVISPFYDQDGRKYLDLEFQNKIQRCSMICKDDADERFGFNSEMSSNSFGSKEAERFMQKCNTKCVDKHIDLLKSIERKIASEIDRTQL